MSKLNVYPQILFFLEIKRYIPSKLLKSKCLKDTCHLEASHLPKEARTLAQRYMAQLLVGYLCIIFGLTTRASFFENVLVAIQYYLPFGESFELVSVSYCTDIGEFHN